MASRSVSPIFVGRQFELGRLRSAYARAAAGEPQTVLIGGEAGIGKSRLIDQFASRLDAAVAAGACIELGGDGVPFAPFTAVLRSLDARGLLDRSGWEAAELARVLPELGDAPLPPPRPGDDYARIRLLEAVHAALQRAAAARPLIVVVDDLHWADRASRELFGYLARVLRTGRVLMIGAYRDDELHRGHPLRGFLAELDRVRGVERIDLPRFDIAQTALQLRGILGATPEPDVVEEVFCRAEGNAFFTEEVACGVAEGGSLDLSWSLRDLLMGRVERLPELTQRLLRLLACAVQPASPRLAAAVAGLGPDELTEALRPAFAANILVPSADRDGYRFRHALMREVIQGELLPGEDTRIRLRLAETLEADHALVDADCLEVQLAHYWYRAHTPEKAFAAALRAAEAAHDQYAFSDELAMLERALELWGQVAHEPGAQPDDVYLMYRASLAAGRSGASERGLAFADAGLAAVDEAARPALAALLLDQRAKHGRTLGRGSGIELQERGIELLRGEEHAVKRGFILAGLASALSVHGRLAEALAYADEALALSARSSELSDALYAQSLRASLLTRLGRADEGLELQRRTRRQAFERGKTPSLLARIDICLSSELYDTGRFAEAVEVARTGLSRVVPCNRIQSGMLLNNLAEPLIALGRWDEASRHLDEGIDLNLPGVHDVGLLRIRAELRVAQGRLEEAQADLQAARRRGGAKTGESQYLIPLNRAEAALAAALGRLDEVRASVATVLDRGIGEGDESFLWELLALAARVEADRAATRSRPDPASVLDRVTATAAELPRHTAIHDVYAALVEAEALRAAGRRGSATAVPSASAGRAKGGAAVVAVSACDPSCGPELWNKLVFAADEAGAPMFVRAYARYRLADAAVAAHADRALAAQAAMEARALAEPLGAAPLLAQVDALIAAARLARRAAPKRGGRAQVVSVAAGTLNGSAPSPGAGVGNGAVPGLAAQLDGVGIGIAAAQPLPSEVQSLKLTRRELEVLKLVAEGLSNGQIGSRLFITTKTASVHVSNILAKLGVATRTEAAAVAHRLHVLGDAA